jgi:hypothetical protein
MGLKYFNSRQVVCYHILLPTRVSLWEPSYLLEHVKRCDMEQRVIEYYPHNA